MRVPGATASAESNCAAVASVLMVGLQPDDPLALSAAPGRATTVSAESLPPADAIVSVDLVVEVSAIDDLDRRKAFAEWARLAATPTLAVALGAGVALVGPLTVPGRVGCGLCALQRMAAAGAASRRVETPPPSEHALLDLNDKVRGAVTSEIRYILGGAPRGSRLLDHVLVVDSASGESSRHRFVPLALCPACGGAATLKIAETWERPAALSASASAEDLLAALAGWLDPITGIVPALLLDRDANVEAGLPFVATAAPPHVVRGDGSLRRLPIGWGKGPTLSGAILSAVGEAIERYAPSLPDPARLRWDRLGDLGGEVLDPRCCALYCDDQYGRKEFPYVRFDPEVRHPWVLGRWLDSGEPVWVPAVFTFLSLELGPEHLICQGTSNGLAASTDLDDAALRATLELVERDALMSAWMNGCAGRRLAVDGALDRASRSTIRALEALGVAVELYLLPTSACGATALCLAVGDGKSWPGISLGLGTDLDPYVAVRKAILELGQTAPHLRHLMRSGTLPAPPDPRAVREMLDHAAYYFPAGRASAFDRLRGAGEQTSLDHLATRLGETTLAGCAATLQSAGVRVALVDVTSADVATGPFRVARAISPDLQPISYGFGNDRLPVRRFRERGLVEGRAEIHPIW